MHPVELHSLSAGKLLDRECLRHFVPSRRLHPFAPLKRLSPVDLLAVFFIPIFKKEDTQKGKNPEQLRAEKERVETWLAQEQRKLQRLENRKKYLEKGGA